MSPQEGKAMALRRRQMMALLPALAAASLLGSVALRRGVGRLPPPRAAVESPGEVRSGRSARGEADEAGAVYAQDQRRNPAGSPDDQLHVLAIADSGSGNRNQQAVADQMAAIHRRRAVDLVVMAGDNI